MNLHRLNLFEVCEYSLFCLLIILQCAACGDDETIDQSVSPGDLSDMTVSDMGSSEVDGHADLVEHDDVDAAPVGDPPSFRSVLVTIEGELSSEADLNNDDAVRILPETFPAEFRCFVQDDGPVEDLLVQIVDGEQVDFFVPEQFAELSNGLWKIYLDISPGMSLSVRIADLDGHVVYSPNSLILPTQQEAVVDHWVERFYETNQQTRTVWNNDYLDDGQWSQEQIDTGIERGGTFHFDDPLGLSGDILTVEERFRVLSGDDGDDDDGTVEWAVTGNYYTDETYFSHNPFFRQGEGETEVDTWTRQVLEIQYDESGVVEVVAERNETLILNDDDTWSESWDGYELVDSEQVLLSGERNGTYDIELNDDYTESIGNFLARQIETLDGEAVIPEEGVLFELYVVKLDRLLISPLLRLE
jgi:hypothetical protein